MAYAIVAAGGKQYRMEEGKTLRLERIPAEPGKTILLEKVVFARNGEKILAGKAAAGVKVEAEVLRHGKGDKVLVFKYRRKKGIRKKTGHRQGFTEIRVSRLVFPGS